MRIFSEHRVNINSGELGGDSGDKVYLSAPELLAIQYQVIEKSLYRVPGVKKLRRIALIPSERRHFELDTLLRHVLEPVLSISLDGRIIAANLATARAFGVNLDQLPGLQLQRFLPHLPLAELLRGLTVPRYGLPVTLRGRGYRLDWSPIALTERSGSGLKIEAAGDSSADLTLSTATGESIAGAVLTLQREATADAGVELPPAPVLWNFDHRRQSCLRLREMAPIALPLLIVGERGSGKSTFAAAAHYLSPNATEGSCYCVQPQRGAVQWPEDRLTEGCRGTLIVEDLHLLSKTAQLSLLRERLTQSMLSSPDLRLIATCRNQAALIPGLAQVFSSLSLSLPPLRTMRPALQQFAGAVLSEHRQEGEPAGLPVEIVDILRGHDWPDNFSGLKGYLAAARAHCRERQGMGLERQDLPDLALQVRLPWRAWSRGLTYRQMIERWEKALLTELMSEHPSTRELARQLAISHTSVANKLRKYGLGKSASKTKKA